MSSASTPSLAISTSWPRLFSISTVISRSAGSSSTTRMRAGETVEWSGRVSSAGFEVVAADGIGESIEGSRTGSIGPVVTATAGISGTAPADSAAPDAGDPETDVPDATDAAVRRQVQAHRRADADGARQGDVAAVLLHDVLDDGQAEAAPLRHRLGREERLERLL